MRKLLITSLISLLAVPAFATEAPKTEQQKVLYTIGAYQARQLASFDFTPEEFAMVQQGFADAANGKELKVDPSFSKKVQELAQTRRKAQEEKALAAGKAYRDKAAAFKGAVTTKSGLIYKSEREGTGPVPKPTDTVVAHYRGTLVDGKEFDNTIYERKPAEFKLNNVIKCWNEGFQKMKAGGRAVLVCPPELAYGKQGSGSTIPPNSTLVFEVEFLGVKK